MSFSPDAKSQFYDYRISKDAFFYQVAPGTFNAMSWGFSARFDSAPGTATALRIDTPNGPILQQSEEGYFSESDSFSTSTVLDIAYPPGTYTFTVTAGSLAGTAASLTMPPSSFYPSPVPAFTSNTFERLSSYDPSVPFTFTWDELLPNASANRQWVGFSIREDRGFNFNYVFSVGSPSVAGFTSATVPAWRLAPDIQYRAELTFYNEQRTASAGFGGLDSIVNFHYSTEIRFTTRNPLAGERLAIRISQVQLCWLSATNQSYVVQYKSAATTNLWADLGTPVLGNGTTNCITDPIVPGQAQRLYRLLTLPRQ